MPAAGFLQMLVTVVRPIAGHGASLPRTGGEWLTWCVVQAVRWVQPMTLMAMAVYHEPRAAFVSALIAEPLSSLLG